MYPALGLISPTGGGGGGRGPCLALNRFPVMSFNLRMLSACAANVSASPLNPYLVGMPVSLTFSSLESLYIIKTVHFATLNSLTTDDSDSCNSAKLISTDVKLLTPRQHKFCFILVADKK